MSMQTYSQNKKSQPDGWDFSFWLQVGILTGDILEAGTFLRGIQVAVTYDEGTGVTLVQVFEQRAE